MPSSVGRDLAVTAGAVVFRNEVCELLQYSPMTDRVSTLPLVMVPPADQQVLLHGLGPGPELRRVLRSPGLQMFVISWRNPTSEQRDWGIDTYVDAVNEAVHAACEIAGTEQANTVSLCAGGITTAAFLGYLAATQDALVNCATFAVTLLDFSVPDHDRPLRHPQHRPPAPAIVGPGGCGRGEGRHLAVRAPAPQRPDVELLGPQQPARRGLRRRSTSWPGTPTPPVCRPPCTPTSSTCS